ncbi:MULTISPECIES: hypothetical protein [unclassified Streptomyces]|uniref:Uncharacterized protein n=1 Tax=Streptomyces sp. NBC_00060 TaxID=2975636 RepID=A0AAU2GTU2_9ACTN
MRTYRTWLWRVRDVLVWDEGGESEGVQLSAPPAPTPPYGPGEITRLRSWAKA